MCGNDFRAMDVRHPQYLGTAPMIQLTEVTRAQGGERSLEDRGGGRGELQPEYVEIGDTSEEAVNINETTTESVEETEHTENAENNEKLGNTIMVSEISMFTLAVDNLQFNCYQCNRTNSSEKGLTQHLWMKQYPSKEFRHYHFDYCSQGFKKYLEDKKKREEGNMKCNIVNVPKGHIIHSDQNNIWNVNSKCHTITDHTKRHMKIHTISLYSVWQRTYIQEPHKETREDSS